MILHNLFNHEYIKDYHLCRNFLIFSIPTNISIQLNLLFFSLILSLFFLYSCYTLPLSIVIADGSLLTIVFLRLKNLQMHRLLCIEMRFNPNTESQKTYLQYNICLHLLFFMNMKLYSVWLSLTVINISRSCNILP